MPSLAHRIAHFLSICASKMGDSMKEKVSVYAEDMTDDMMNKAIAVASAAFKNTSNREYGGPYKDTASYIRQQFEKLYGPSWNCVVGRHFGSYVTHEIKTYIYFSVKAHVSVLLWKT